MLVLKCVQVGFEIEEVIHCEGGVVAGRLGVRFLDGAILYGTDSQIKCGLWCGRVGLRLRQELVFLPALIDSSRTRWEYCLPFSF